MQKTKQKNCPIIDFFQISSKSEEDAQTKQQQTQMGMKHMLGLCCSDCMLEKDPKAWQS